MRGRFQRESRLVKMDLCLSVRGDGRVFARSLKHQTIVSHYIEQLEIIACIHLPWIFAGFSKDTNM